MARQKPETRIQKMLRTDGALCLTFINTGQGQRPTLESYAEILVWSAETGALDAAAAARLELAAAEHPKAAAGVARKAVDLHARLRRMVAAVADGGQAEAADLEALNVELGAALGHRLLVDTAAGFHWSWDQGDEIDRPLWPVLLSAGVLLASEEVRRIRRCPSEGCGLFFVARGSGRPRKWCGAACCNRSTSRRHYRKVIKPAREKEARGKPARDKAKAEEVARHSTS